MASNLISSGKFLWPFLLSWLVWIGFHAGFIYWMEFNWIISIVGSLIFNVTLALICFSQLYIMQFYLPKKDKAPYIILTGGLMAVIVTVTSSFILRSIYSNNDDYINFINRSNPVRIGIAFLLSACTSMVNILITTLEAQKENVMRKHEAEKLTKEAELYDLRSQLQPHFLFNSLNSISALAGSKPEEARKMVQQLSDFLRGTIRKDNAQLIPLQEELNHLNLYFEIEKVRFGHRLKTEIKFDENCVNLKIPSLLLQPVLENAIKFGLYDTLEEVTITIHAIKLNNDLIVTIKNPFDATSNHPKKGTGFGLNAVQRRLYLLFSRNDLLHTSSENNIFTTTLKIPQPV